MTAPRPGGAVPNVDVIAVGITSGRVRVFARSESPPEAEAIIKIAVMRRGCDVEFYTTAPCGRYNDGDAYAPEELDAAPEAPDA